MMGFGRRTPSEMIPFPFISISRLLRAVDKTVLFGPMSPGLIMPRTITSSCWLFMKILRPASTTRSPLGRTAITRPVRVVWKRVLDAVDPCPLSADEELPESRGLVDAGALPKTACDRRGACEAALAVDGAGLRRGGLDANLNGDGVV